MLATKISFMNELSNLADKLDVDIEDVRNGMGSDSRIGYQFIYPGCGYGGSCFPKDVSALIDMHEENNISGNLIKAVDDVNKNQRDLLFKKINFIFESLANKKISIWGLAFKPETDDIREAPSNYFIDKALKAGAFIQAYDPIAIENARKRYSQVSSISFFDDQMECLDSSEALVIFTECKSFRQPNFAEIKSRMALPIIIDGRNLYNPNQLRDLGIDYYGIGRGRRI
jgi:UDPglucose 6-dehydrogenase